MTKELRCALVFSILMENNGGIVSKSPGYILEKWEAVKCRENPEVLLIDVASLYKLNKWIQEWITIKEDNCGKENSNNNK